MADKSADSGVDVEVLEATPDMDPKTVVVKITHKIKSERDRVEMEFKAKLQERMSAHEGKLHGLQQKMRDEKTKMVSIGTEKLQQCMHNLESLDQDGKINSMKELLLKVAETQEQGEKQIRILETEIQSKTKEHQQRMKELKAECEKSLNAINAKHITLVICFEVRGQLHHDLIDKQRLSEVVTKLRDNMDVYLIGIDKTLNFIMESPKREKSNVPKIRESLVTIFPAEQARNIRIKDVKEGPTVLQSLIKLGEKIPIETVAGGLFTLAKTADVLSAIQEEIGSSAERLGQIGMRLKYNDTFPGGYRVIKYDGRTNCDNHECVPCSQGYYHCYHGCMIS